MADLIDREKTKAAFEPWLNVKGYSEGELNMLKAVLYEITVMPSADAVEVVRCKDCKWYSGQWLCLNSDTYGFGLDDYCSYGVRKNG